MRPSTLYALGDFAIEPAASFSQRDAAFGLPKDGKADGQWHGNQEFMEMYRDPNSLMLVILTDFWAHCRSYFYTWIPRATGSQPEFSDSKTIEA